MQPPPNNLDVVAAATAIFSWMVNPQLAVYIGPYFVIIVSAIADASDIIFAYVRDGKLYHRRQRDRFATEYLLSNGPFLGINKMGMNAGLRFQFLMAPVDNPE